MSRSPRASLAVLARRGRGRELAPGPHRSGARQQAILGGSTADVVDFAVSLQGRIDDLHRAVDEVAAGLTRVDRRDRRLGHEHVGRPLRRLRGRGRPAVGVVRLPRLDRTGTVVTAIQGRDYARVYVKELERGKASLALSPEEAEAVERAMAR